MFRTHILISLFYTHLANNICFRFGKQILHQTHLKIFCNTQIFAVKEGCLKDFGTLEGGLQPHQLKHPQTPDKPLTNNTTNAQLQQLLWFNLLQN